MLENQRDHRLTPPHNLPHYATPFIDRTEELIKGCGLLRRSDVGLLVLTGPGGTGKTRLSIEIATAILPDFPQGVYFIPLASLNDPTLMVRLIAQTLEIKETGEQNLFTALKSYMVDKQLLLILDNFEHLLGASAQVKELLNAAPRLKILITSQALPHIYGEQEFAVPSLTIPDLNHLPDLAHLSAYSGVRLFVQRAQQIKPEFHLTVENAAAVAEICVRLDGLPLAIELAAARIKSFTPHAMLLPLRNRLDLLIGGAHELPARQQTLKGAIDWSYSLLEKNEQILFCRLAVFAGGCTEEAAERICNNGEVLGLVIPGLDTPGLDIPGLDIIEGLISLLDKSLIWQREEKEGTARYGLLETMREYALLQLRSRGSEDNLIRRAHARYYLKLVENTSISPHLMSVQQEKWLTLIDREYGNLRAVLEWSLGLFSPEQGDVEIGLRMAYTLGHFWYFRGYLSEGRRWLDLALSSEGGRLVEPVIRADALHTAASLAEIQGDYPRAISLHEESLTLFRESGDNRRLALFLHELGLIALKQGDYTRARTLYMESLALFQEADDKQFIGRCLLHLGEIACLDEKGDEAKPLLEQSLAIFRESGIKWGTAHALLNLGKAEYLLGEYLRATELGKESLNVFDELGDKQGIAYCLEELAAIAVAEGQNSSAAQLWGAAESLRENIGAPLPPADKVKYDEQVNGARTQLGEVALRSAWQTGRRWSLEQTLAYVLLNL